MVAPISVHEIPRELLGRISGIVDWSGGAFGDPRYDAALAVRPKVGLFDSPEDHDAFFGGYGNRIITDEEYEYFNGLYEFFRLRHAAGRVFQKMHSPSGRLAG